MATSSNHPVGERAGRWIHQSRGHVLAARGNVERLPILIGAGQMDVERAEQSQLLPRIVDFLGECQSAMQRRAHLRTVGSREERSDAEGGLQPQFPDRSAL